MSENEICERSIKNYLTQFQKYLLLKIQIQPHYGTLANEEEIKINLIKLLWLLCSLLSKHCSLFIVYSFICLFYLLVK